MRIFKYFAILVILSCRGIAQEPPSCPEILDYIQTNLPLCGVLKSIDDFIYVDVDDEYIHKLVKFIQEEGFEEPPYFGDNLYGAHITVIYRDEMKNFGIDKIEEYGEIIHFIPKECKVVNPPRWKEIEEVYFIVVEAPDLNKLRAKYGLPKREHDFHITIGVKPKLI